MRSRNAASGRLQRRIPESANPNTKEDMITDVFAVYSQIQLARLATKSPQNRPSE